jgi:hypothetical protein
MPHVSRGASYLGRAGAGVKIIPFRPAPPRRGVGRAGPGQITWRAAPRPGIQGAKIKPAEKSYYPERLGGEGHQQ